MQVIIPMAGDGWPFVRAGYSDPKPLTPVDGRPMITHVVQMFPHSTDFLFLCNRNDLADGVLERVLGDAAPASRVVVIEAENPSPIQTILEAEKCIQDSEPTIVVRGDFASGSFGRFLRTIALFPCDAVIATRRGVRSSATAMATFMRSRNGRLLEARGAQPFSSNASQESVASGAYYFRSGAMLKHYLRKAALVDSTATGEHGVAAACNQMVRDGLSVSVHELDYIASWRTPEDVDEYARWSEYFARWADWSPARPASPGATLIPIAGEDAHGSHPKPLAPVAGVPMIERVLSTLPASSQTMAICRTEHIRNSPLSRVMRLARPGIRAISLAQAAEGHACLCLMPDAALDSRSPVLIAPGDASLVYDEYALAALSVTADCVAFTSPKQSPATPQNHARWVTTSEDETIDRVLVNEMPPATASARALAGMFWFREAGVMFDAIRHWVDSGRRTTEPFDLSLVLQYLKETGYSVRALDVRHRISFATPHDVQTYEYWEGYFRGSVSHAYMNHPAVAPMSVVLPLHAAVA